MRDHAFGVLDKPHVVSMIRPVNHPSQGVARKLGMRPVKLTLFANLEHWMFRADRPAVDCHTSPQFEIDLMVGSTGLEVDGAIGVRVKTAPTGGG